MARASLDSSLVPRSRLPGMSLFVNEKWGGRDVINGVLARCEKGSGIFIQMVGVVGAIGVVFCCAKQLLVIRLNSRRLRGNQISWMLGVLI